MKTVTFIPIMFKRIFIAPAILMVRIYQWVISPLFPPTCRHTPTCSAYTIEALKEWGLFKGLYLGVRRVLSCRPGGSYGHDPVPKRLKE